MSEITAEQLAELMAETGEDEKTIRDMWDAFGACANEGEM